MQNQENVPTSHPQVTENTTTARSTKEPTKVLRMLSILAFIVSLSAMLGSLYFSEIKHYDPCNLCWYQRIFMYPLVFIMLVDLIRYKGTLRNYYTVLLMSSVGIIISIYHIFVQFGNMETGGFCGLASECSNHFIMWFGFITIPVLCATAFALIIGSMITLIVLNKKKSVA